MCTHTHTTYARANYVTRYPVFHPIYVTSSWRYIPFVLFLHVDMNISIRYSLPSHAPWTTTSYLKYYMDILEQWLIRDFRLSRQFPIDSVSVIWYGRIGKLLSETLTKLFMFLNPPRSHEPRIFRSINLSRFEKQNYVDAKKKYYETCFENFRQRSKDRFVRLHGYTNRSFRSYLLVDGT